MNVATALCSALVAAAWVSVAHAVPLTVSLTVSNASGTIEAPGGPMIPFAGVPVTLTASGDTTQLMAPPDGASLAFSATVTMAIPGIVDAPVSEAAGSGVEIGNEGGRGFIYLHVRRPASQQPLDQGALAFDTALFNYRYASSFGPRRLDVARVGELFMAAASPAILATPDGTVVTVSALSDAVLTIVVDSAATSAVPTLSNGAMLAVQCLICIVATLATRRARRRAPIRP